MLSHAWQMQHDIVNWIPIQLEFTMSKEANIPGKPLHAVIGFRALTEFKDEVDDLAKKAGYETTSDYLRDAVTEKNERVKNA